MSIRFIILCCLKTHKNKRESNGYSKHNIVLSVAFFKARCAICTVTLELSKTMYSIKATLKQSSRPPCFSAITFRSLIGSCYNGHVDSKPRHNSIAVIASPLHHLQQPWNCKWRKQRTKMLQKT